LIFTFVFSAIAASVIINSSERIQSTVAKLVLNRIGLKDKSDHHEPVPYKLDKDIAFLGFFRMASSIVEDFRTYEVAVNEKNLLDRSVVIDFNESVHDKLRAMGVTTIYGDIAHMDTLHHVGIGDVKLVISTIPDSVLVGTSNAKMVEEIRVICPNARVIATAESPQAALAIYHAGADYVIVPRTMISQRILPVAQMLLQASEGSAESLSELNRLREAELAFFKARVEIIE
jgi:voltage-gated potassium channel Kch